MIRLRLGAILAFVITGTAAMAQIDGPAPNSSTNAIGNDNNQITIAWAQTNTTTNEPCGLLAARPCPHFRTSLIAEPDVRLDGVELGVRIVFDFQVRTAFFSEA